MRDSHSRRGSALLIVLGFLSFMVVSAVAFSIYMRSERVPSSVLRRTEASRHLVKAGLAAAMAEIDQAICNDVYPGAVTLNSRCCSGKSNGSVGGRSDGKRYFDLWIGRVFMPPEPCPDDEEPDDIPDGYVASTSSALAHGRIVPNARLSETVPVLTLEGLGYLPPALVNDVRHLARKTWSAKWRYFNFNAGRSAFVAVNVSDFFDIAKCAPMTVRTSASPVSSSYLFGDRCDSGHLISFDGSANSGGGITAEAFYSRLVQRMSTRANYPFISMLDYNLTMQHADYAPFVSWVGGKNAAFYPQGSKRYAYAKFITDSYSTNSEAKVKLTRLAPQGALERGQPFPWTSDRNEMEGNVRMKYGIDRFENSNMRGALNLSSAWWDFYQQDFIALYDYLDRDDVPTSLAFPTVERVPMVAEIEAPQINFDFKMSGADGGPLQEKDEGVEGSGSGAFQKKTTYYYFNPSGSGALGGDGAGRITMNDLRVHFVFPFKRGDALNNKQYRAQALVRIFLASDKQKLRLPDLAPGDTLLRPDKGDWGTQKSTLSDHAISLWSNVQNIDYGDVVDNESDAMEAVTFKFSDIVEKESGNGFAYRATKFYPAIVDPDTGAVTGYKTTPTKFEYEVGFHPINSKGEIQYSGVSSSEPGGTFYPVAAVWIRVTDANGNTVDLSPANVADDANYNALTSGSYPSFCGEGVPLLKFSEGNSDNGGTAVSFAEGSLSKLSGGWNNSSLYPRSFAAVDPRYNFAPENFIASQSSGQWLNTIKQFIKNEASNARSGVKRSTNGRNVTLDPPDPDIFMFVSNQGYLQSMAELAFLPRIGRQAALPFGDGEGTKYNGALRANAEDTADSVYAWRTYSAYNSYGIGDSSDQLWGFGISDGDDGIKVNPYTDDNEIFLAALANTPYDWWAAGTNYYVQSASYGQNQDDYNLKKKMLTDLKTSYEYAFGEKGNDSKMSFEELQKVANALRTQLRNSGSANLLNAWCSLNWFDDNPNDNSTEPKDFLGVSLSHPLHSVDRKYLFGFWKNCFANKQQLFLVFVRAEPTSAGGDSGGATAQLGGRAVALVWRDPVSSDTRQEVSDNRMDDMRRPHKMRVLFYHQFD